MIIWNDVQYWYRKCPTCNTTLQYRNKTNCIDYAKENRNCRKCAAIIRASDPIFKKIISEKAKKRWKDPEYRRKGLEHIYKMSRNCKCGGKNSKAEINVENALQDLKIAYIPQYPIVSDFMGSTRRYYDFYLPEFNKLIEVHGDYWHGYNIQEKNWNIVQRKNALTDMFKLYIAYFNNIEYHVIWEHDTKQFDILLAKLEKILYGPFVLIRNPFYNYKDFIYD